MNLFLPSRIDPHFGRHMTNKILWFLILVLIVLQSGCALEQYHQVATDHSGLKYSQDDSRSGPQFGPEPG